MLNVNQLKALKELHDTFVNKDQKLYLRYQDLKIVIYHLRLAGKDVLRIDLTQIEEK
jgi:hypothetical protein